MAEFFRLLEKIIRGSELSDVTYQLEGASDVDPEETPLPLITYRLDLREPHEKFPKPRSLGYFKDERIPDKVVELQGQLFDMYVVFNSVGRTTTESWQIADKLEDVMLQYAGTIKSNAAIDIRLVSARSSSIKIGSQDIFSVTTTYLFILNRVYQTYLEPFGDIEVQGEIAKLS